MLPLLFGPEPESGLHEKSSIFVCFLRIQKSIVENIAISLELALL